MKHFTKLFMLIGFIGMMWLKANTANAQTTKIIKWGVKPPQPITLICAGTFAITIKNDNKGSAPSYYDVTVQPASSNYPEPSVKSFVCKYNENKKQYINDEITFAKDPVGAEFIASVIPKDAKGNSLGEVEKSWVTIFAKGEEKEQDPCSGKLTIDKMSISPSRDEKGNLKVLFSFPIKAKKGDPSAAFYNYIKWDYCNSNATGNATGYVKTFSLSPKYNEKTSTFEATCTFPTADKTGSWIMNDMQFGVTNPCGDAFYYEAGALLLTGGPIEKPDLDVDVEVKMNHPDSCGKPDVDSLYWEVGTVEKTKNTTPVTIHFPKNYVLGGNILMSSGSTITAGTQAKDSKGNTETQNGTMTLSEKTGWYETTLYFSKLENGSFELTNLNVIVYNTCGDSNGFVGHVNQAKLYTGPGKHRCKCSKGFKNSNQTNDDSCNANYKLKEVNYNTSTSGGIYTMSFSFNFEKNSEVPKTVSMYVQLNDCNDNTSDIAIKLNYDESSGTYKGSQAISQDKDCPWIVNFAGITGYDACKNTTVWEADFEYMKNAGVCCRIPGALVIRSKGR